MTKTEELNILFEEWANSDPEYKERFSRDGIIEESKYNNANNKILFVTKEPNNPEGKGTDYIKYWKDRLDDTFSRRL